MYIPLLCSAFEAPVTGVHAALRVNTLRLATLPRHQRIEC